MTNLNELDLRLRAFVNAPDNFLDSIALVNALHNIPVLASDQPYALDIEGQKVTPVFSDKEDLENFKEEQSARIDRIESRTKEMNCLPSSTSSSNEKMIVAQYARGKSEAEIAKDLRIGIGEIDLVLKLANLK